MVILQGFNAVMVNYSGAPRPDLWEILIRQGETRGFEQPRDSETGLDRITIVHDHPLWLLLSSLAFG